MRKLLIESEGQGSIFSLFSSTNVFLCVFFLLPSQKQVLLPFVFIYIINCVYVFGFMCE